MNCSNKELDTRQKIVAPQQAAALMERTEKLTVITGHFDPLTAAHARRLAGLHRNYHKIVAIVTNPPEPVLSLSARAELVAALAAVDYVIAAQDNTVAEIVARLKPDEVIHEEFADLERTRDLIAHVRERQTTNQ